MQKTIFMVDDNITNLAKAEELLEKYYLMITLSSAEKMFTVLKKITPDLILLDIDMPEMDGLEAIKLLKADADYADIPVIFLTGLTDSDTEAYGIELGAVDFITKPFSEPVLLNRIRNRLLIGDMMRERTERIGQLQNMLVHIVADNVMNRYYGIAANADRISAYKKILSDAIASHGFSAHEDIEITTFAEVYDALTSGGTHAKAFTSEEAAAIILEDAGRHLDSKTADIFCGLKNRLETARIKMTKK